MERFKRNGSCTLTDPTPEFLLSVSQLFLAEFYKLEAEIYQDFSCDRGLHLSFSRHHVMNRFPVVHVRFFNFAAWFAIGHVRDGRSCEISYRLPVIRENVGHACVHISGAGHVRLTPQYMTFRDNVYRFGKKSAGSSIFVTFGHNCVTYGLSKFLCYISRRICYGSGC